MADIKQYLDLTEELLRELKQLKLYLKSLEQEKEKIVENVGDLSAISYDGINVNTNTIVSPVEQSVLKRYEEALNIIIEIDKTKATVKKLEAAIANLDEIHRRVVEMYVVEGMDWINISDILKYSDRQLRKKKDEAIKSIALSLFGMIILADEKNKTLFDML